MFACSKKISPRKINCVALYSISVIHCRARNGCCTATSAHAKLPSFTTSTCSGWCSCSSLELPRSSAEWASLLCLSRKPFGDALQVEGVPTDTPHYRTVVPRVFAIRRATIKRHPTYSTNIVTGIPGPACDRVPVLDVYHERHQLRQPSRFSV